ncbi:cd8862b3-a804-499e-bb53-2de40d82a7f3-CDS [Sclerotinia trifoliorum]|uniref:Cd8862b3-a804-499e-bb53-2de40d82a7f3-CDS n=1 Tax=Sclerotinia trifoliorum TaxID=28548 RepID=A0A8H2VSI3_9HELO|nr:cd8862b3-a804-499e-bb53-2de40d82a7f3-CDS [Sclerotinia trifoliorum]
MPSDDLTKWITSEIDFYALLGLTPESFTADELRRAYRKTALQYHPDKLGAAFDADKYEQFQAANDVLADPESKQKYDNFRNGRMQRQRAAALFEGKRRAMKEDLEARERGGSLGKRSREDEEMDENIKKLAEEGRKRRVKRESMMSENVSSPSSPMSAPRPPPQAQSQSQPRPQPSTSATSNSEDEKVARLERLIAEATAAKAKRKADKKARKAGKSSESSTPDTSFKADSNAAFNGVHAVPCATP